MRSGFNSFLGGGGGGKLEYRFLAALQSAETEAMAKRQRVASGLA
jgi:hypothetical protein